MDCLDETTAARLLDRSLSGAESERVACHIDSCDDCRAFVAALARSQAGEGSILESAVSSFADGFAPKAGPAHELDAEWSDRHRR
jgi:hypothetical protein